MRKKMSLKKTQNKEKQAKKKLNSPFLRFISLKHWEKCGGFFNFRNLGNNLYKNHFLILDSIHKFKWKTHYTHWMTPHKERYQVR